MKTKSLFLLPLVILAALFTVAAPSGCGEAALNTDWATDISAMAGGSATSDEIQAALDLYAEALVSKNREQFLSVIDAENVEFASRQDQLFANLTNMPFQDYSFTAISQSDAGGGTVLVKVETAYTLAGSFSGLPDPERAAYYMVRKESGWKLSGDVTAQALGKPQAARIEDFEAVVVTEGRHVIVLSHAAQAGVAAEIRDLADAAYPRLVETLPGVELPKVPIRLFSNMGQIELAYPGGWQEWTGGASRPLGSSREQGGEIIVDAGVYRETADSGTGYNGRMLAHEMTHVALFPESSSRTPPFLVEGLADYVAGIEPVILLRQKLRSGEAVSPTLSDLYQPSGFQTLLTTEAATLAYESSDLAVEYLELTYGNQAVLRLLRQFKERGHESIDQDQLVNEIFNEVLGVSWEEFERAWRDYVLQG